jgi:osmotically-inducible protein OsmY
MDSVQTPPLPMQGLENARLAERIEHALRTTGYGSLRGIEVTVDAQLVILGGRVSSYYLKQVAQETALSVAEAHQVRNNLEVVRPS